MIEENQTLPISESTLPISDIVIPEENMQGESELNLIAKLQVKKNKLRKALKEKGILPKGAHNDYDNYEYFSEAQYKELFTELFSKFGIELYVNEVKYESFKGTDKQPFGRLVTLACTLIDIDTGYSESSNHTGEGLDRGDKAGYKATTGALKRFLSSTFLVATKDDPEREDEKPSKPAPTKKTTLGTISPEQRTILMNLYGVNKKKVLETMKKYKKAKFDDLTKEEASKVIKECKGEK